MRKIVHALTNLPGGLIGSTFVVCLLMAPIAALVFLEPQNIEAAPEPKLESESLPNEAVVSSGPITGGDIPADLSELEQTLVLIRMARIGDSAAVHPSFSKLVAAPSKLMHVFRRSLLAEDQLLAIQLSYELRKAERRLGARAAEIAAEIVRHGRGGHRLLSAECAGLIGVEHESLLSAFNSVLADPDARLRFRAVAALGRLTHPSTRSLDLLERALDDPSPLVAARAEASIEVLRVSNPAFVLRPRKTSSKTVRTALTRNKDSVTREIPSLFDKDDEGLIHDLRSSDTRLKAEAAMVAALRSEHNPEVMSALESLLRDKDERVRFASSYALGQIGSAAVPSLGRAVTDPDPKVRLTSVQALRLVQPASDEVLAALMPALDDENESVRLQAALAFAVSGSTNDHAIEALVGVLGANDGAVDAVAPVLSKANVANALPKLIELLASGDPHTRAGAARALGASGAQARTALPALERAAMDQDEAVRISAETALTRIRSEG